jgi:hypothetical protein
MPMPFAVIVLLAATVLSAGCASPVEQTSALPPPVSIAADWEIARVAHADTDPNSCACERVRCYERVRKGCRATCGELDEPECKCEARCTIMGRLVASNHCGCRHVE